jgi:tetratricopeptide (TPR) repeat protein
VEDYHRGCGQDDFLASVLSQAGAAIQKPGDLSELVGRLEGLDGGSVIREVLMSLPPPNQSALRAEYDVWRTVHCGASAPARDPLSSFVERFQTADAVSVAQFNQTVSSLFQAGRLELLARVLDAFAGTPFETPKAIRFRAVLASRLERWREAARDWARVVANNPDDGWASLNIINAQIHCSEFDSARQGLAALLQSGRAEAIGALPDAASCAIRLGDVEMAQAMLENRSFQPEDLRQHQRMQLARVFALSGRAEDALAFYGKKQDIRPVTEDNLALIVDPGLTITSGHHLNYTLFCWDLFQTLTDAGQLLTPLLLCSGGVPLSAEVKALNVRPELVFEPYAYEEVPTVHRYLRPLNECVYRDLSRPDMAGRARLVVAHSMRAVMVEGFSRWAADVFRQRPGVAVVGLIEVDHLAESPEVIRYYEDIYREGLSRMATHPNIHLLVYVETRMGKEFLERLGIAGMEVKLYPYLAASLSAKYCSPLDDGFLERPICLGAVGGTRQDRGSWTFPRLIANTQDLAGSCRWKLQLNRQKLSTMLSEADAPLVEGLSASPNVSIVDETLTSAGYYELLDQIDVVILPYQDRYSVSGSGVLYEAVYMGKYLLVPSKTFMPEELARLGHPHRVFEEPTLACIEEQVRWVVQNQAQVKRELMALRQGKPHALPAEEFYRSIADALQGI